MCFCNLVACDSVIRQRGLIGQLRPHWFKIFLLFSIFLLPAILDVRFFEWSLQLPSDNIREEGSQDLSAAEKSTEPDGNFVNKTKRLISLLDERMNGLPSEIEIINGKSSKMAEITKKLSNTLQRDYENPLVTTKLLYEKGHDILPRNVCSGDGKDLTLMIVITSSLGNFVQRQAIRSTWATIRQQPEIDAAFFVGKSTSDYDNQLITQESQIFGDIIRGNFIDSYNNLTLKSISMLDWTMSQCNHTRFLLKADDDVFINPDMLFAILKRHKKQRNAIIGKVARYWKVERKKNSNYYIPRSQYKNATYPNFNTGPAYLLTNDVIARLYSASLVEVFFKLEDVFLTGLVARKLNITHINCRQFHNRRLDGLEKCTVKRLAAIHDVNPLEMVKLWTEVTNITLSDCSRDHG